MRPSPPPSTPSGATLCRVERSENRAGSRTSYSRRMPRPPRNVPAPAESAISSQRTIRVGYSLSTISIGAILPFVWLTDEPETRRGRGARRSRRRTARTERTCRVPGFATAAHHERCGWRIRRLGRDRARCGSWPRRSRRPPRGLSGCTCSPRPGSAGRRRYPGGCEMSSASSRPEFTQVSLPSRLMTTYAQAARSSGGRMLAGAPGLVVAFGEVEAADGRPSCAP